MSHLFAASNSGGPSRLGRFSSFCSSCGSPSSLLRDSFSLDGDESSYDEILTVFQSAPLVAMHGTEPVPMFMLDFEHERKTLTESLSNVACQIKIVFEEATTDRFQAFLTRGEGRILHFSGHGKDKYLAMENGWGVAHALLVKNIKEWIKLGGQSLQFVFVSACLSKKVAEAFITAGVPHVVCCTKDGLDDLAAVEFEKAFYMALACGKKLSEAFKMARLAVIGSSLLNLHPHEREHEAKKFVLLPEDTNHDVQIFRLPSSPVCSRRRSAIVREGKCVSSLALPPPPRVFVGRELDMFNVIDSLKSARLVRVSGQPKVGKSALVKACCRYIGERRKSFSIDDILWTPFEHEDHDNVLFTPFTKLFEYLQSEQDSSALYFKREASAFVDPIIRALRYSKSLLVIDAKEILLKRAFAKLSLFLEDLLDWSEDVKVIVIHRPTDELITTTKMPAPEADVEVKPLPLKHTVTMFGRMCQHVAQRRDPWIGSAAAFSRVLMAGHSFVQMSKRSSDIYTALGGGNPGDITIAAKNMSVKEYAQLLKLGRRKIFDVHVASNVDLERQILALESQRQEALDQDELEFAQELQEQIEELEFLRKEFPSLDILEERAAELQANLGDAKRALDVATAQELKTELKLVEFKIGYEKLALEALGASGETYISSNDEEKTWIALDAKIRVLRVALSVAVSKRDFAEAAKLDSDIVHTQALLSKLPSITELQERRSELQRKLDAAVAARKWNMAGFYSNKLDDVIEKLELEYQAGTQFGFKPPGAEQISEDSGSTSSASEEVGSSNLTIASALVASPESVPSPSGAWGDQKAAFSELGVGSVSAGQLDGGSGSKDKHDEASEIESVQSDDDMSYLKKLELEQIHQESSSETVSDLREETSDTIPPLEARSGSSGIVVPATPCVASLSLPIAAEVVEFENDEEERVTQQQASPPSSQQRQSLRQGAYAISASGISRMDPVEPRVFSRTSASQRSEPAAPLRPGGGLAHANDTSRNSCPARVVEASGDQSCSGDTSTNQTLATDSIQTYPSQSTPDSRICLATPVDSEELLAVPRTSRFQKRFSFRRLRISLRRRRVPNDN